MFFQGSKSADELGTGARDKDSRGWYPEFATVRQHHNVLVNSLFRTFQEGTWSVPFFRSAEKVRKKFNESAMMLVMDFERFVNFHSRNPRADGLYARLILDKSMHQKQSLRLCNQE